MMHLADQIKRMEEVLTIQRSDRKEVYERLRSIEQTQAVLPNSEEMRAVLNRIEAQKLKKEFWRKMTNTLITRGVLAAAGVVVITYLPVIHNYINELFKG